jgi:biopolymer transport protein ExbB/TolQ
MASRLAGRVAMGILMTTACVAAAQAPGGPDTRESAIQQKQRQAGAAYSDLQKAQYDAKLAEQEFLNARDAHAVAQKQADARRQQLDAAKKALDAAQARVVEARKRYDDAVTGVDEAFGKK